MTAEMSTTSAPVAASAGLLERRTAVSAEVLATIAANCTAVDGDASFDARAVLQMLAADGALDLGLPGSAGTYADQAQVLADLAAVCMTSAFSAWAHRMTVEYLVVHGGERLTGLAEEVRSARRPGSTALAGTFRAAAGVAEIPVTITDGRADGFISWASNLYDDAVVVTGAGHGESRRMIAFDRCATGVELLPVSGLLALDATHSGALRLAQVAVTDEQVLAASFDGFIAAVRPTFLVLQSSFAVGLASASLAAIGELRGLATVLEPEVTAARATLARLAGEIDTATATLDAGGRPPLRPALQLRLDAAHLAVHATQLELAARGGAGYSATSPTARRVREALFLPVQSPTEVQLQWELQQTA